MVYCRAAYRTLRVGSMVNVVQSRFFRVISGLELSLVKLRRLFLAR